MDGAHSLDQGLRSFHRKRSRLDIHRTYRQVNDAARKAMRLRQPFRDSLLDPQQARIDQEAIGLTHGEGEPVASSAFWLTAPDPSSGRFISRAEVG